MKWHGVVGVLGLAFGLSALGEGGVRQVPVELGKLFAPEGYDSDDNVEVMVVAKLPSSCFKLGDVVTEKKANREIRVSVNAIEFEGKCHTSPSPVPVVLSLGQLTKPGTYRMVDGFSNKELGALKIKQAPKAGHGTDEELYPLLVDSYLDWRGNSLKLRLAGVFADDCEEIKKVTFEAQDDVLIVIPEVDHPEGPNCQKGMFAFDKEFEVKADVPRKAFLLHTRAMHGRSVNKLVFPPATLR